MSKHLYYPLTIPQESIWDIERFYKESSYANISMTVIIRENVKLNLLEEAVNVILQQHEGLRLRIEECKGKPLQYVSNYSYKKLDILDYSYAGCWKDFEDWQERQTRLPLIGLDSELFYFALVKLSNNEAALYLKFHHCISDAWTTTLVIREILNTYKSLLDNVPLILATKPSYTEYIQADISYRKSENFEKSKAFWQRIFQTVPQFTHLKERTHGSNIQARRKTVKLSSDLSKGIADFSKEYKISPFIMFFAILSLYIAKITSKSDLVIGTPVLNRINYQQKNMVGMFICNLPFRISINSEWDFLTYLNEIKKEWKQLLKNQNYPYQEILKDFRKQHNHIGALTDVFLSYQNAKFDVEGINFESVWNFNGQEINTLSLHVSDWTDGGSLRLDYDYLIEALSHKEVEQIHHYLINLLRQVISEPNIDLENMALLTSQEEYELIYQYNQTQLNYPKEGTVHQLFEAQAKKTPEQIAVIANDKQLTYRELNERANQLAKLLRLKGVTPDSIVGIMINRSPELIVGILAVLKAGGAYLPIDPLYPLKRIEDMVRSSRTGLLLTNSPSSVQNEVLENMTKDLEIELLDLQDSAIYKASSSNLINVTKPNHLAYVIYTSGSTGAPKGVMIEHRSVNNFVHALWKIFSSSQEKVIVSLTTVAFDIFIMETLVPLSYGLSVVIANEVEQKIPGLLFDLIIKNKIDMLQATPSKIQSLLKDLQCSEGMAPIMDIFIGGEPLTEVVLNKLQLVAPAARIYNMYGPTETTVWSMYKELTSESQITLGKPIANTQIYILDQGKQIVPQGVTGEIHIGGEGLARGYLYRQDLTQERFIANPFHEGEIIYKTGDLGRWTPEGEIEYLGRNDDQVKVRGFRIEPKEIGKVLIEHADVHEAVVISHVDGKKRNYLCAYLVGNKNCPSLDIRAFLEQRLPEYMIPAKFIWLDAIPLTLNSKVDKRSLPDPRAVVQDTKPAPPENSVEEELVRLWSKALEVQQIGVEDNFFLLGGDSLAIIEILTEVWSKKWDLNAQDFYDYPTVRQLSDKVRGKLKEQRDVVPRKDFPRLPSHYELQGIPGSMTELEGNVLLTGATGFLGIHLLWELLNSTSGLIYCLMRGSDLEKRFQRLFDSYFPGRIQAYSQRIKIIKGDISQKHFKMTPEGYSELGKNVDSVIHAAGLVKHYGEYSDFEKINVQGTQEVIDFCITFGRPLQHISTISIAGNRLTGDYTNGHFDEVQLHIGQNYLDNLYIRSKFEAEVRVLEATRLGLKAAIFRVGILTGRYSDGHFQGNIQENAFYQKLKSFLEIKSISQDMLSQELEFTPVDACAQGIVDIIRTNSQPGRVFHMFNHKKLKMTKLIEILYSLGIKVQILDTKSFYQLIESYVQSPHSLSGFVLDLTEEQGIADSIQVESTITQAYLAQIGFQWPEITEGYLTKLIKYMVSVGFLLQII